MRVVVVSGSHPRHLYVVNRIIETGMVAGVVLMRRENMIDDTPAQLEKHIGELYTHHFNLRLEMENAFFGQDRMIKNGSDCPVLEIERDQLNSIRVEAFIKDIGGECIFSYGPDLLRDNILKCVNGFAMNLHGGLSPWYKGAATMFWPFYFLEPNYVGTTLHFITQRIDAGNIVHQTVPVLEYGDGMHKVACKAIVAAAEECCKVIEKIDREGKPDGVIQKGNGKLFLEKDWRPDHLRLIYDLFEDKIVDKYLSGEIGVKEMKPLVSFL